MWVRSGSSPPTSVSAGPKPGWADDVEEARAHSGLAQLLSNQLRALVASGVEEWGGVEIVGVEPNPAEAWPTVEVLFTLCSRPGCTFGCRCSTRSVSQQPEDSGDLGLAASICLTSIEEWLWEEMRAPHPCGGGAVAWL
jgi:hypothetical protein